MWPELKKILENAITAAGNREGIANMKIIAIGLLAAVLLIGFAPFAAEAMILIILEFGAPPLFQP